MTFQPYAYEQLLELYQSGLDVTITTKRRQILISALSIALGRETPLPDIENLTAGQRLMFGMVCDNGAFSLRVGTAGQDVFVLKGLGLVNVEERDGILTLTPTTIGRKVQKESTR